MSTCDINTWPKELSNKAPFCRAPFVNLNFEQNGNMTVCCYNRSHILGTYPKNSILDAWRSVKADELREAILKRDLSKGCKLCLHQIESQNYSALYAKNYDGFSFEKYEYPKVLEFELTNTCNLECVMCSGYYSSSIRKNRENKEPFQSPYDLKFVEQLVDILPHLQLVKFLGGEPFLIQIYYHIWETIKRINPHLTVVVTTNGTILTNKIKSMLNEMDFYMAMSIDSVDKANFERIRKNAKFDKVMESLEFYLGYMKKKRRRMGISVCPMTLNWHEIPSIVRFCNSKGANIYFNTVVYPLEFSLRSLPKSKLSEVISFLEKNYPPKSNPVEIYNFGFYQSLVNQLKAWHEKGSSQI